MKTEASPSPAERAPASNGGAGQTTARGDQTPVADNDVFDFDLETLKSEVARMTEIVGEVAANRSRQAADAIASGAQSTRDLVRAHPWAAIGIAGAAGALLAMLIAPSTRRANPWSAREMRRMARHQLEPLRSGYGALTSGISDWSSSRLSRLPPAADLATQAERVLEAVTNFDPKAMSQPIAETVRRIGEVLTGGTSKP